MIVQGAVNLVLNLLENVLLLLPDVSFDVSSGAYVTFMEMVQGVLYFLPVRTVASIFYTLVALQLLRIAIKVIKTIWDLLPIL